MKKSISSKWFGLFGFIGFGGFMYFWTNSPIDLYLFGFFAFFGNFFVYKILDEKEDERMIENKKKAGTISLKIAFYFLFLICILATTRIPFSREFFAIMAAMSFSLKFIIYIVAFYIYERKS